jgi:adenylate cyclase
MESDEAGTLDSLRAMRRLLVADIERHHGRVVNTAGDGLLAEFASAVEAQRELAARQDLPGGPMRYRIGINLGDVMVEDGDLFGEGVNVAARLQGLAEPGGILISGTVHDVVRGKLEVAYDYLGPQQVKNIAAAVPAYRINLSGEPAGGERPTAVVASPPPAAAAPGKAVERAAAGTVEAAGRDVPLAPLAWLAAALLALSLLPALHWTGWVGLFLGYGVAVQQIRRRLRGRAKLAAQLAVVALLLLGINILAGGREWWFVYPGVVLVTLAVMLDPGGLMRLAAWARQRANPVARSPRGEGR